MTLGGCTEPGGGGEKMTNIDLSWLFSCLVGAFRTPRCIPFPPIISPRSPQSNEFLRGHKYFPQTPCCFHIILQTPPNDSKRQTMHPFSSVLLSVHTHFTLAKKHVPTP